MSSVVRRARRREKVRAVAQLVELDYSVEARKGFGAQSAGGGGGR